MVEDKIWNISLKVLDIAHTFSKSRQQVLDKLLDEFHMVLMHVNALPSTTANDSFKIKIFVLQLRLNQISLD